jgi:hypothetical protein
MNWQFALSWELCGAKELMKSRQKGALVQFDEVRGGCRSIWDSDRCFACQGDDPFDVTHCR